MTNMDVRTFLRCIAERDSMGLRALARRMGLEWQADTLPFDDLTERVALAAMCQWPHCPDPEKVAA